MLRTTQQTKACGVFARKQAQCIHAANRCAEQGALSLQTEREVEPPAPTATTAIGIDVGIERFATLSDGTFYAPLHSFRRHEARLRRYQRAMSRKQKFSKNWLKAKRRVQTTHARIGNARRDYLHKATTAISRNHALVCVEDLQVRNLSKSAAGTLDKPGRKENSNAGVPQGTQHRSERSPYLQPMRFP